MSVTLTDLTVSPLLTLIVEYTDVSLLDTIVSVVVPCFTHSILAMPLAEMFLTIAIFELLVLYSLIVPFVVIIALKFSPSLHV